jgi:hypothetical protein
MLDHEHREGNRVEVGVHTRIPFCHFVCGAGSISRTAMSARRKIIGFNAMKD